MHHVAHFLVYNMLAKFQLFCIITCRDILYFVFWLPYCHTLWHHQYLICIIQKLWISLEWYEIWQKWKHHSSSLLKAFQIHLFFWYLNFSFHRHFKHDFYGRRQKVKDYLWFVFVSFYSPQIQIFSLHWQLKTDGKSFIFAFCRSTQRHPWSL